MRARYLVMIAFSNGVAAEAESKPRMKFECRQILRIRVDRPTYDTASDCIVSLARERYGTR
jgi:hypothetical protein